MQQCAASALARRILTWQLLPRPFKLLQRLDAPSLHTSRANRVGVSAAGKQPVSKPKSVSLAALGPDTEAMPLQELRSASNHSTFDPSLLLKPSNKPGYYSDTASSHPAAVKAAKEGPFHTRDPAAEVEYPNFEDFKENRSLMSLSRNTVDYLDLKENRSLMSLPRSIGHMNGSGSNSPPASSKAEVDTMMAKLRSRSAGRTSAGQARSNKSSGASSTRRAFSPLQTEASRANICPFTCNQRAAQGSVRGNSSSPTASYCQHLQSPSFHICQPSSTQSAVWSQGKQPTWSACRQSMHGAAHPS